MPVHATVHTLRLKPGEDLKVGIAAFVTAHQLKAGHISTCVGSLTDYALRFANQKTGATGSGHFEIVSLVGTVGVLGSHLHLAISDEKGTTLGGHLLEGSKIYTTAEIVIIEDQQHVYARTLDPTFGYEELEVVERKD